MNTFTVTRACRQMMWKIRYAKLQVRDALHTAVVKKHRTLARTLIILGADVNKRGTSWMMDGTTPLTHAIRDVKLMRALIAAGADVNARNEHDDSTPLHHVCMQPANASAAEAVRLLLRAGADVNAVMDDGNGEMQGYTPLHLAASYSTAEVVRILVEEGKTHVDVLTGEYSCPNTPLACAVRCNNLETARELIRLGARIDTHPCVGPMNQYERRWTPLQECFSQLCDYDHDAYDMLDLLLRSGARIESVRWDELVTYNGRDDFHRALQAEPQYAVYRRQNLEDITTVMLHTALLADVPVDAATAIRTLCPGAQLISTPLVDAVNTAIRSAACAPSQAARKTALRRAREIVAQQWRSDDTRTRTRISVRWDAFTSEELFDLQDVIRSTLWPADCPDDDAAHHEWVSVVLTLQRLRKP